MLTKRTANGLLSFDTRDQTIGRALYIKREYEVDLMRAALDVLRRDGYLPAGEAPCLIDAGANIGTTCVGLLTQGYVRSAIAVEPEPANFALLERNVAQNGLAARVRCLQVGLASEAGTRHLARNADNWGGHYLQSSNAAPAPDAGAVTTLTLDELFARHAPFAGPEGVGLVWLDVEGYEGWCLKGATRLLQNGIPVVAEFWPEAITRSGMDPSEYSRVVIEQFTHFYRGPHQDEPHRPFAPYPISEIRGLFENPPWKGEGTMILVNAARGRAPAPLQG